MSATWGGLAQIPQLLNEVKTELLGLKTLASTPSAVAATGSPLASAAIVALGLELGVFLVQTEQAIEHDIAAIGQVARNYHATESDLTSATGLVINVLTQLIKADEPAVNAGVATSKPSGTRDRVGAGSR